MIIKGSVRRKSSDVFKKVLILRKQGLSYSEIKKETGIAKSTINNWLTLAGLTLSKEHLQIQTKKRLENNIIATEASKRTRALRKENEVQLFIQSVRKYFLDPFFVGGIMLYQAEGSKTNNGFSNSDFRLIRVYINFLEKYLLLNRNENISFRLYIHETRKGDLIRSVNFWSRKLNIDPEKIKVSWKHNIVTKRRTNLDYHGQFEVRIKKFRYITSKLLTVSDIILEKYQRADNAESSNGRTSVFGTEDF